MPQEPTDEFTIISGNGDIYHVQEFAGVDGTARYQTEDGQEVIRDPEAEFPGAFLIPSLGIAAVDQRAADSEEE
jgi:hypothetical protein